MQTSLSSRCWICFALFKVLLSYCARCPQLDPVFYLKYVDLSSTYVRCRTVLPLACTSIRGCPRNNHRARKTTPNPPPDFGWVAARVQPATSLLPYIRYKTVRQAICYAQVEIITCAPPRVTERTSLGSARSLRIV